MKKTLEKIERELKKYKSMLEYNFDSNANPKNATQFDHGADGRPNDVPDIPSTAEMQDIRADKLKDSAHMNGVNVDAYNYWAEDKLDPKVEAMADEISKDEEYDKEVEAKAQQIKDRERAKDMVREDDPFQRNIKFSEKYDVNKDELDDKIKHKMRQEMDRRNFGEADATRHVIDRERGEKEAEKPKEGPLLQSEMVKFDSNGQWSVEKSNYGPKGWGMYDPSKSIKRKATRTGEEVESAGKNVGVRQYTTSGSKVSSAHEAAQEKEQRKKTKRSTRTLADMSEEEKQKLAQQYGAKIKD